ncbi:interferon-stimulated gene 20 kDa protein isoform X2 [Sorex fumeus]|uniref:interferon-stimulated gene 20 kDa protein isoform X2 n=1 Tax=Sorex fumeus TaxID=62283 RepID=UPI0024AD13C2|nr:interferon-stimulated gene 20 kDa protein isoform X2 [Sorex fumeus]
MAGRNPEVVAIDCEMVGTGPRGRVSELARCSVVNYQGEVLYDKYVQPKMPVTDFRSRWSGVTRQQLEGATPFAVARLEALKADMGRYHTYDSATDPWLRHAAQLGYDRPKVSLRELSQKLLGRDVQSSQSGHSSVEDAKATMELYQLSQRLRAQDQT